MIFIKWAKLYGLHTVDSLFSMHSTEKRSTWNSWWFYRFYYQLAEKSSTKRTLSKKSISCSTWSEIFIETICNFQLRNSLFSIKLISAEEFPFSLQNTRFEVIRNLCKSTVKIHKIMPFNCKKQISTSNWAITYNANANVGEAIDPQKKGRRWCE